MLGGEALGFPGTSHLAAVADIPSLCSPGFESRTAFSVFSSKAGSVPLVGFMEKGKKKPNQTQNKQKKTPQKTKTIHQKNQNKKQTIKYPLPKKKKQTTA